MGEITQRFGTAARKHCRSEHVVERKAQPRKHKAGEFEGRGGGLGVRGGRGVQLVEQRFERGRGFGVGNVCRQVAGGRAGARRAHYCKK